MRTLAGPTLSYLRHLAHSVYMLFPLTSEECLAKAAEIELKADQYAALRADCLELAIHWRDMARQVKLQDHQGDESLMPGGTKTLNIR
jgi:hypothetical protein